MFAWLIVVFLQFVIHYFVMGSRYRNRRSSKDTNVMTEAIQSVTHENVEIRRSFSKSESNTSATVTTMASSENTEDLDQIEDDDISCDSSIDTELTQSLIQSPLSNLKSRSTHGGRDSPTTVAACHDDFTPSSLSRLYPNPADEDSVGDWSCRVNERELSNDDLPDEIRMHYYSSLPHLPEYNDDIRVSHEGTQVNVVEQNQNVVDPSFEKVLSICDELAWKYSISSDGKKPEKKSTRERSCRSVSFKYDKAMEIACA